MMAIIDFILDWIAWLARCAVHQIRVHSDMRDFDKWLEMLEDDAELGV
jgi:hypothetical protein